MRKLIWATLAVAAALATSSTFAADIATVALLNPAAFETPESIQFDRHGNAYISMALTGEVRKIAPDGAQSTLAFLPIRPDIQPCGNGFGLGDHGRPRPRPLGQRLRLGQLLQPARPRRLEGDAGGADLPPRPPTGHDRRRPAASPIAAAGSTSPTPSSVWCGGSTLTARARRRSGPTTRC